MSTFAPNNVIDLLSSDDEDEDRRTAPQHAARVRPVQIRNRRESVPFRAASPMVGGFPDDHAFVHGLLEPDPPNTRRLPGGEMILIDGEEVFIPDEGSTVAPDASVEGRARDQAKIHATPFAAFTFNDCLARVLEMFPDISHGYIENLYNSYDVESDYENIPGRARLDKIVEQLVSGMSYPKEEKAKLKRKREDSIDASNAIKKWEGQDRGAMPSWAKGPIAAILKADFPEIPKTYINTRFLENKHLFHTYVALAKDKDGSDDGSRTYGKGRPGKAHTADAHTIAINCGYPELVDELIAARDRVREVRKERAAADARKRAEQENLQKAIAAGEVTDCSACFDELPMNRQIHCDGSSAHFTCFGCAETYIKTQVGDSRCNVTCTTGCGAPFAKNQLDRLSDKQLVGKLAQLQQEKDIRDAGLDDLEDCPFCEYKAIMPPIEEDFEFRCANPECEKVSCRRCKAISHVPSSCEEHAKDNKINSRHKIEETMTAAMIRSCNKCKKQFIKDLGCNKMSCPSCGNMQCYVCSETLKSYDHFDQQPSGRRIDNGQAKKCPLYDNVEERHEKEVRAAEAKARAEVVESNPDVAPEDLEIKVSDAVKKATNARIRRNGGAADGMFGGLVPPGLGRMLDLGAGYDSDGDDEEFEDFDEFEDEEDDEEIYNNNVLADPAAIGARQARANAERQVRRLQAQAAAGARGRVLRPAEPQNGAPLQAYLPVFFGQDQQQQQQQAQRLRLAQAQAQQQQPAWAGLGQYVPQMLYRGAGQPAPQPQRQQNAAHAANAVGGPNRWHNAARQPGMHAVGLPGDGDQIFGPGPFQDDFDFFADRAHMPGAIPRAQPRAGNPRPAANPGLRYVDYQQRLNALRAGHNGGRRAGHEVGARAGAQIGGPALQQMGQHADEPHARTVGEIEAVGRLNRGLGERERRQY